MGSPFTGSRSDKSQSEATYTSLEGLRQPGVNRTGLDQNVPGSNQVAIVSDTTLRAGAGPDLEALLPGVEPTYRAQLG